MKNFDVKPVRHVPVESQGRSGDARDLLRIVSNNGYDDISNVEFRLRGLYGALNISGYIASNNRMMGEVWIGNDLVGSHHCLIEV
jgi:hypothetical protein